MANRGEIAVRIIRTLTQMGIRSATIYTDEDRGAKHAHAADEALYVGSAGAYLDVDVIIEAARRSGAQALHPGYGFLSENPGLARAYSDMLAFRQARAGTTGRQAGARPPAARSTAAGSAHDGPLVVENLTEREREVLQYVSQLLPTVEIASEMYVSVNTVKSHLKSICRKLGAATRNEAVRRARQLELI